MDTAEKENNEPQLESKITPARRRSGRLSSSSSDPAEINLTSEPQVSNSETETPSKRRSSRRRSKAESVESETSDVEASIAEVEKSASKRTPRRRSTRRSVSSSDEATKASQPGNGEVKEIVDQPVAMEVSASESTQSDSQPSESESSTDEKKSKTETAKQKRSRRTSRLTTSIATDLEPVKEVSEPNSPVHGVESVSKANTVSITNAVSSHNEKENKSDDTMFLTPGATIRESAKKLRAKSMGALFSGGRSTPRNNRNSLILRTLSPDEG